MKPRNQLLIVATNSFWNTTNFILAGVFGFVFSVILTRYLGPHDYGEYGYIFSVIAVLILFFGLGIGQAIAKYVPKYFADKDNRLVAIKFYKSVALIQLTVSTIFIIGFYLTRSIWLEKIGFSHIPNGLLVFLLLYIPIICSVNSLVNFVGASQNYKKITISNLIVFVINLILFLIGVHFRFDLNYFIIVNIVTNVLVGIVLYTYSRILFSSLDAAEKIIDKGEAFRFTSLAYIGVLVQYVVWSYSEIFFLRKYSSIENVGFYTLAFMISSIVIGILATSQKSVYNAQFELLEQGQEIKADTMTYLTIKYSAILFFPFVIFISLLMTKLITVFYGQPYFLVALVFPFVIMARTINAVFNPITTKVNNNNKLFSKVVGLIALGAVINLIADYLLIPKYQLFGAGYANLIGQAVTTFFVVVYILRNVKFHFNLNKITKILLINLILAFITFIFYKLNLNIWFNLLYCLFASVLYVKILKMFKQFEIIEYKLALSLVGVLPNNFKVISKFIYKIYKKI